MIFIPMHEGVNHCAYLFSTILLLIDLIFIEMAVKKINGIEDIADTAADVLRTKMRYDYERSLTPEERKQRYEDSKKVGKVLLIGFGLLATGVIIYSQTN